MQNKKPKYKKLSPRDKYAQRKAELDKWARARNDAKSNVGEYRT